jgi:hypothetical protein
MSAQRDPIPLGSSFFAGLTDYTFTTRLGVADPPLVDYISELLVRFMRSDALYKVRNPEGRRVVDVTEMLAEAEARTGVARRDVHRHIGDYTLFWAGFYPESLRDTGSGVQSDRFVAYCEHGKRAYYIASMIPAGDPQPSAEILARLSHDFELCVYGLGEIRREWVRRDDGPSGTPFVPD